MIRRIRTFARRQWMMRRGYCPSSRGRLVCYLPVMHLSHDHWDRRRGFWVS